MASSEALSPSAYGTEERPKKDFTVDTSSPVMVSGATGYLAGILIRDLLKEGLTVHATVRDPTDKERLAYLQAVADRSKGVIKFFKGELLEPDSFREAMQGCSVVFHTASPVNLSHQVDPYRDLIIPAVQGTTNVLQTACQVPTVKRVVLTSSIASMYDTAADIDREPNQILTENSRNRVSTATHNPYRFSKSLAEQKAWEIAGSQTQWTLVVLNPSLIMGAGLRYHSTTEPFGLMRRMPSGLFVLGIPNLAIPLVDINNVSLAHIAAAWSPRAKGRYILNGHCSSSVELGQVLKKYFPQYPFPTRRLPLPKSVLWVIGPYIDVDLTRNIVNGEVDRPIKIDNSKSIRDLGIEYRTLEDSVKETFQQVLDANDVKVNRFYLF